MKGQTGYAGQAGKTRLLESDWSARVRDYAKLRGWLVCHLRAVRLPSGAWGVPIEGDRGLQDWMFARRGTVLLVELKTDDRRSRLDAPQQAWRDAAGEHARVWRPSDWDEVRATLDAA